MKKELLSSDAAAFRFLSGYIDQAHRADAGDILRDAFGQFSFVIVVEMTGEDGFYQGAGLDEFCRFDGYVVCLLLLDALFGVVAHKLVRG